LINSDYSKTLIVVRVPAGKSISETEILVNQINQIASNASIPHGGKLSELVGQDVITVQINKQLMSSQASSMIVALLLVLACLIIGFNSTTIGFLSLIPVLVVLSWEPGALVSLNNTIICNKI
jgi:predicted RND superfamily exporter protein